MCAVEFNYQTYFTKEQWENLPKDVQDRCKTEPVFANVVKNSLASGTKPEEISTKLANTESKAKANEMMGLTVEKNPQSSTAPATVTQKPAETDIEALKPKVDLSAMDDKKVRKASQKQWEEYFTARYAQNPEEAKKDIVKVLYQKEVQQTAAVLEKIQKDNPILVDEVRSTYKFFRSSW